MYIHTYYVSHIQLPRASVAIDVSADANLGSALGGLVARTANKFGRLDAPAPSEQFASTAGAWLQYTSVSVALMCFPTDRALGCRPQSQKPSEATPRRQARHWNSVFVNLINLSNHNRDLW